MQGTDFRTHTGTKICRSWSPLNKMTVFAYNQAIFHFSSIISILSIIPHIMQMLCKQFLRNNDKKIILYRCHFFPIFWWVDSWICKPKPLDMESQLYYIFQTSRIPTSISFTLNLQIDYPNNYEHNWWKNLKTCIELKLNGRRKTKTIFPWIKLLNLKIITSINSTLQHYYLKFTFIFN